MALTPPPIFNLPDEIIQHIFTYVSDESILDLDRVCKRFSVLTVYPLLWKDRCSRFRYWEPHHEIERKRCHQPASDVLWKELYVKRCKTERSVAKILNDLIHSGTGRIEKFEMIAREGYDAKDCLKMHLECSEDAEDVLARRYFASEALAFIHRRRAIQIWIRANEGESMPLEEALGAFDLFVTRGATRDVEKISTSLDALAEKFRVENLDYATKPHRDIAQLLIIFMRNEGFTGATPASYRALINNFLGISIDSNRATLPLTTSVTFVALASRLGLKAVACALIGHVIVRVESEEEGGIPTFWDPYKTSQEIDEDDLRESMTAFLPEFHSNTLDAGFQNNFEAPKYPTGSTPRELIVRVARNILEAVRLAGHQNPVSWINIVDMDDPPFMVERSNALYAALSASIICGPPASTRLLEHMCTLMQRDFDMDVGFFERDMFGMIGDDDALLLNDICRAVRAEDRARKRPLRRNTKEAKEVRHRIGTVFKHKRYGYQAVITGWTEKCATDENWIHQMNVDSLARGRHQPFYNVFVSDGSSRYVAEDNINPQRTENCEPLTGYLSIGKYFKRLDKQSGCFISNMREEFPDD